MTGAYLRVNRGSGFENIEVEHLTDFEREQAFKNRTHSEVMRWLHMVCNKLAEVENEHFVKVDHE